MRTVLIALIRTYQKVEAPRRTFPLCGRRPCCSQFAIRCLKRFSLYRAVNLILERSRRCGTAVVRMPHPCTEIEP
ncbi:MAG: membrane protein insertion efficiency factor YidD [Verrucomicrobiales bacterium]|nr:membrane protein insertion efficiency factor YidD [Verrucomicrobiales bacterium]